VISPGNPGSLVAGPDGQPTRYKIVGDVTVPGGGILSLLGSAGGGTNNPMEVWVTGKLTTSGSGYITQVANVSATWYVGGDITVSGDSYLNKSGSASKVSLVGYGTSNKATISGSGNFVGTLDAPGYDVTLSGQGAFVGALIGNTLTISGSGGFIYDTGLGSSTGVSNYAFASWFEDTR
jgi:hypothetical protein